MRRIGGSDIGKLLGLSRYGNAADVYLRIVEDQDDAWNANMERGAAVEPELRGIAQRMMGLELEDCASDYHSHPALDFAWAQIDDLARWRGLPLVVDYKSQSRWAKGWGAAESDCVPPHIHAQVGWEMACADRDVGMVFVGFGDDAPPPQIFSITHVVPYVIERDEQFEGLMVSTARDFWNRHILPRVPPSIKPLGKKQAKAS